jgi:F420H(2)-dependent quinone reductase
VTTPGQTPETSGKEAYREPPWILRKVGIPIMRVMVGRFGVGGARLLEVQDPDTGKPRSTPIHVLELDGARYLVSTRGDAHWVRALRESRGGTMKQGRSREQFTAVEVPEAERLPILRPYLQSFWKDIGSMFAVDSPDASDDELRAIAPDHPIFRIDQASV